MSSTLCSIVTLPTAVRCRILQTALGSRAFHSSSSRHASDGHENPLGLPRSGKTPPNLAARMKRGLPEKKPIPNVKKVIAVSSAKGGVGKSTIAVNLALALSRQGHHTGLLDTDLYGPSIPTLLNLETLQPSLTPQNHLHPLTSYGLPTMSIGFLIPPTSPLAWRGLLLQKALSQLLFETAWPPNLDLLILDLPPGTGDIQLTIPQSTHLSGAIIVSTPQDLALRDAVRGMALWEKVGVPILGMVQNMSGLRCQACGCVQEVFGVDGAKRKCEDMGIDLLGDIPLHPRICSDADAGKPTVVADPDGPQAEAFYKIARAVSLKLGL